MRIGIFGGTFDPVHESHIEIGLAALRQCGLDKVFYVPTRPWQKTARASEEARAEMLSLALAPYADRLIVDRRELDRGGPSYSIDTLYSFRKEFGSKASLFFILGTDQWQNLKTWILWQKFPLLSNLLVFVRNAQSGPNPYGEAFPTVRSAELGDKLPPNGLIVFADFEPKPFSSTDIRRSLTEDSLRTQRIEGLPASVQRYILEKNLYLPAPQK